MDECIQEDVLREFLEKNRAEARTMCIYEYNEEERIIAERETEIAHWKAVETTKK